jgi:hypothetical protein
MAKIPPEEPSQIQAAAVSMIRLLVEFIPFTIPEWGSYLNVAQINGTHLQGDPLPSCNIHRCSYEANTIPEIIYALFHDGEHENRFKILSIYERMQSW